MSPSAHPTARSRNGSFRAFTLVELLAVIAIIALLIAVLLPVLNKARRKALVLASPIAYVGKDTRVHMTDPNGKIEFSLNVASNIQCPVCHSPPVWNASGTQLAFRSISGGTPHTIVINPMSDRRKFFPETEFTFLGWSADSDAIVESNRRQIRVTSVDTGKVLKTVATAAHLTYLAPASSAAPAPYVGITSDAGVQTVLFVRKDFSAGRRIWSQPGSTTAFDSPRTDLTGQFVGWTQPKPSGGGRVIMAFKHVDQPPNVKPTTVGEQFQTIYFCDWTEQGELLGNASHDDQNYFLVVFDRKGRLVRKLATAIPPAKGAMASYRKYGHR